MNTDAAKRTAPWYHYVLALAISQAVLQTLLLEAGELLRVGLTIALILVVGALVTVAWRSGLTRKRRGSPER